MLTAEQVTKLQNASGLIFEVQKAMLDEDERLPAEERSDWWRVLYKMRIDIGEFIYADKERALLTERVKRAAHKQLEEDDNGVFSCKCGKTGLTQETWDQHLNEVLGCSGGS